MQISKKEQKNQEKLKSRKGITLVSLVVTIVILIILAIVSFNGLLGENGLITSAQKAVEMQKISSVQEELEMAKGQAYIEGKGHIDADRYFEILEEEGIIIDKEEDVEKIEEGVYEVTTEEGYVFEVIIPEDGEIEIDYIGKGENIGPRIKEIRVVERTTNSIKIEVDTRNAEGGEYSYWIKKEVEGEESWKEIEGNNNTCTFSNLEENVMYDIKVIVKTKSGSDEEEATIITGELPEGTITFTEGEWIGDGTAKVTINTTAEGYTLQYQIDGIEEGKWINTTSGAEITGLGHNQTVYGRLYDGVNGTKDEASVEIKDEIAPTVTVEKGEVTTKSITVSVRSSDKEWGMPESVTYSYYIKPSNGSYTTASYTGTNTSYTFNNLSQTTSYDVKVTTQDKAGNTGEGEAKGITTETIGGAGEGLIEGNIIASNPTWSSNKASITLSTSTGLTIQYQVNGITEGSWKTGTSVTGLNHNDTVYARLTDGTNYGDYASVSIKDTVNPSAPTISLSGTAGNNSYYKSNVTATITAGNDSESGANKVRYSVSGAQTVAQTDTTVGTTSTSITISADGTSTITAYTLDKAGNVSSAKTQVVYKDNTEPRTANLTVGTVGETTIAVTASGADATSGVYSYQFQRSTTSSTSGFTTVATQTSSSTSYSYTYSGLTAGTIYYLRVIVTDKAGNTKTGTAVMQVTPVATIPENTTYVGYYADVDGNRSVDGVIYADLAIGGSGQWGSNINGSYTIPKGSNFKKYEISKKNYTDDFGTKDVIKVTNSSGNERFYVMALDDVDSSYHCWYDAALANMSDYASTTSTSFGSGKQNTKNMISKWNSSSYGAQNDGSYTDVWGLSTVQSKINANPAWFIPSREEWAAFAGELGITISNYSNKGLRNDFSWSSSQGSPYGAWGAGFYIGSMRNFDVRNGGCVRLGTTF